MPVKINGLPAHVLLVHAVVVLLPIAALMLAASAVWPAARAKLGFLTPAVALVALILVPITTHAGEWLEDHLGYHNKAIERHADLGGELLPWAVGIFVMSVVVYVVGRQRGLPWRSGAAAPDTDAPDTDAPPSGGTPTAGAGNTATLVRDSATTTRRPFPVWVTAVVAVLSIAVATGGTVQLIRIGDSGAKAVWAGVGKN